MVIGRELFGIRLYDHNRMNEWTSESVLIGPEPIEDSSTFAKSGRESDDWREQTDEPTLTSQQLINSNNDWPS